MLHPKTLARQPGKDTISAAMVPNTSALACYREEYQFIQSFACDENDFAKAFDQNDQQAELRVLPLICHELRHWFDCIGTLWGQEHLVRFYNACNSRINNDPDSFSPIMEYFNEAERTFLHTYYTTMAVDPQVRTSPEPWKWGLSVGHRFDYDGKPRLDRRIVFTRFLNQAGDQICRCPFSIVSLLETGAMASEMFADIVLLNRLPDESQNRAMEQIETERYGNFVYNAELARYSVAAHAVSNYTDIVDPPPVFDTSAQIAALCLNLPRELILKMKRPSQLDFIGEVETYLKQEHDRGYAFLSLVCNGANSTATQNPFPERALSEASLPDPKSIRELCVKQMARLPNQIIDGPFADYARSLLSYGMEVFEHRGVLGIGLREYMALVKKQFIPPILLPNSKMIFLSGDIDSWIDIEDRFAITEAVIYKMNEFRTVCGV